METSELPPPPIDAPKAVQCAGSVPRSRLRLWAIVRDMIMIVVISVIGQGVVAFVARPARGAAIIGVGNLLFGILAFAISGYLAPERRWRHLLCVASGLCLLAFINTAVVGHNVPSWLYGVISILLMMAIGGTVSYLFRRHDLPSA
jgi:hypothetical protein